MNKDEAHDLECARAAIAFRIERASNHTEAREWRKFLREIEQRYTPERSGTARKASSTSRDGSTVGA